MNARAQLSILKLLKITIRESENKKENLFEVQISSNVYKKMQIYSREFSWTHDVCIDLKHLLQKVFISRYCLTPVKIEN